MEMYTDVIDMYIRIDCTDMCMDTDIDIVTNTDTELQKHNSHFTATPHIFWRNPCVLRIAASWIAGLVSEATTASRRH